MERPGRRRQRPRVTLSDTAVTVAHRSDGSGTTANFTKYLNAAATPTPPTTR